MQVDHSDKVRTAHAQAPPEKTVEGALQFLLRLLPTLPEHERAGLLLKPAGENIVNHQGQMVSAGRICYPDGQLYTVLTDIPTTNGPSWHDDGTVDPGRYLPVAREGRSIEIEKKDPVEEARLRDQELIARVEQIVNQAADRVVAAINQNTETLISARQGFEKSTAQLLPLLLGGRFEAPK